MDLRCQFSSRVWPVCLGRPRLLGKMGLLVDVILGRRIADVDRRTYRWTIARTLQVEKVLDGPRTAGDCDEEPPVMVRRRGWEGGIRQLTVLIRGIQGVETRYSPVHFGKQR
jgi:hypothetical protein